MGLTHLFLRLRQRAVRIAAVGTSDPWMSMENFRSKEMPCRFDDATEIWKYCKRARDNGCRWDTLDLLLRCLERSFRSTYQWAQDRMGVNGMNRTCNYAADNRHLEVLQWARDNGCYWNILTCSYARIEIKNGNSEWARDNGFYWDTWTCSLSLHCERPRKKCYRGFIRDNEISGFDERTCIQAARERESGRCCSGHGTMDVLGMN